MRGLALPNRKKHHKVTPIFQSAKPARPQTFVNSCRGTKPRHPPGRSSRRAPPAPPELSRGPRKNKSNLRDITACGAKAN
ncbi:hypothetical protein EVAR_26945_1 [Eumeta japonica]|uniref:Uncharacterized protein n=1 Tax=Eumeta variegata TaxID=151549 RepID=A0A4C1VKK1_EUMVA|nr:hypothetical protein EVAR_26945_1 [Eumeta japonica]